MDRVLFFIEVYMTEEIYRAAWENKTAKQIEKEILSWRKYMDKHGAAYAWHGSGMTPPGSLADGDKISILKDILKEKIK